MVIYKGIAFFICGISLLLFATTSQSKAMTVQSFLQLCRDEPANSLAQPWTPCELYLKGWVDGEYIGAIKTYGDIATTLGNTSSSAFHGLSDSDFSHWCRKGQNVSQVAVALLNYFESHSVLMKQPAAPNILNALETLYPPGDCVQ